MGVNVVVSGSNVDVTTSQQVLSPSGWAAMVAAYGIGYNYPQPTGQTTVYRTGDDADIEATIFTPAVRAANSLKPRQSLADFTTLNNNNAFGNTNRFTDINGLQVYGDDYVIDHYTGLGWYRIKSALEAWNDAIDNALASTQNSYSDWFLPDTIKIMSITNQSLTINPLNYAPFNLTTANNKGFSTSSSDMQNPSSDFMLLWADTIAAAYAWGFIGAFKIDTQYSILCRKHY